MRMKTWRQAFWDSLVPGAIAGAATCAAVAMRGRHDSGNAIAPINASSHVAWGDEAGRVEQFTWRHTAPGVLINVGAAVWWAFVYQKLFGAEVDRRGVPAAILAGAATSGIAYVTDYKVLPRRLTPGWEMHVSKRSLGVSLGVMAIGLALGSILTRDR